MRRSCEKGDLSVCLQERVGTEIVLTGKMAHARALAACPEAGPEVDVANTSQSS